MTTEKVMLKALELAKKRVNHYKVVTEKLESQKKKITTTTDEEFLKLARECGAEVMEAKTFNPVYGLFDNELITLCREIERRTLEKAAEKCAEIDGGENEFSRAIRAMIKEKE